jgi:transcriptional regulator with XRE-family HTH domain
MPNGPVFPHLPERLREIRRHQRRTLSELSEAAGISVAHLSRIEQGKRQPSLDALLRIARTYGMSLGQLTGPEKPGAHEIVRDEDAESVAQGPHAAMRLLSGAFPGLTCVRYDVTAQWKSPTAHHAGEEWIFVIVGAVRVEIEGTTEILRAGDSMHFDAWNPHRLIAGASGASLLLVSSGSPIHDEKGESGAEAHL